MQDQRLRIIGAAYLDTHRLSLVSEKRVALICSLVVHLITAKHLAAPLEQNPYYRPAI